MKRNKVISWILLICLFFSLIGCNGDDEIPDETPTEPDEYNLGTCSLSYLIDILEQVGPQGAIINYNTPCTFEVNSIHNEPGVGYGTFGGVGLPPIEVPVTINGLGNVTFTRGANSEFLRFFYVTETGELYLNNINLENGYLPPDEVNNNGGAILNRGGRVELTDCELVNNIGYAGGAITNSGGEVNIYHSQFNENSSGSDGGAICSRNDGQLNIVGSDFNMNQAQHSGGAIYSEGTLFIGDEASSFMDNQALNGYGGAMHSTGDLTVSFGEFWRNSALHHGGAVSAVNPEGSITFNNCDFRNNTTDGYGGALCAGSDSLQISGCLVQSNTANRGGGMYISGNEVLIGGGTSVLGNHADFIAGGIYIREDATVVFNASRVVDNECDNEAGGIYNGGSLTMRRSTIAGNDALGYSGGGIRNDGTLIVYTSCFYNNSSSLYGGGLNNEEAAYLTNTTFSANQSGNGSAIYSDDKLEVVNSTIAFNIGEMGGDALAIFGGGFVIKNSIVAENTAGFGFKANCNFNTPGIDVLGENLSDDDSCLGFTILENPHLGPLMDNGGDTLTHEILFLSPARDAVTDCTDLSNQDILTDQRIVSRPQEDQCDVGAYERETMLAPITPPISTVVFLQNSSCREKPGSEHHAAGYFNFGDTAEVVGRNPNLTWFQVMVPDSESKCWVWKELVTFTGEIEALPIIAPEVSEIAPEAAEVSGQDEVACQPPDGGCPFKEAPTCWDVDTCSCAPCE